MNEIVVETATVGRFTVKLVVDHDADSPRDAYEGMGTFYTALRNYNSPDKYTGGMFDAMAEDLDLGEVDDDWDTFQRRVARTSHIVIPVYKYEHGAVAYKASGDGNPFHCQWDSGMAGFIFLHADKVREEYNCKRITKAVREKAVAYLKGEVETYSAWANGEVYGYEVENEDGETLDSCWGYYGETDYPLSEGIDMAKGFAEEDRRKRFERVKQMIRNRVPLAIRAAEIAKV